MTRRELVKAAIAHEPTERVPYCISFTGDGEKRFRERTGSRGALEFADNDIIQIYPPWWNFHELGADWQGAAAPSTPARVMGAGSFQQFFDILKTLRANSDKYILVMVYGSHFEKANGARGIENFLADLAGEPEFARDLLTRIIDQNMV